MIAYQMTSISPIGRSMHHPNHCCKFQMNSYKLFVEEVDLIDDPLEDDGDRLPFCPYPTNLISN